jgi:hypothetical protein
MLIFGSDVFCLSNAMTLHGNEISVTGRSCIIFSSPSLGALGSQDSISCGLRANSKWERELNIISTSRFRLVGVWRKGAVGTELAWWALADAHQVQVMDCRVAHRVIH